MSASKRNRFIVVAGIIVIVVIAAVAYLSAGSTATSMTVAQAADAGAHGKKVKVEGNVVDNSFTIDGDTLTFCIADSGDQAQKTQLEVVYDKGVAATFGNGVTAICTGTVDSNGVLKASELVTKCPSKYETSTEALTVSRLLGYSAEINDKTVKVQGVLTPGTLGDVNASTRFVLMDASDPNVHIDVVYSGAIPDNVVDGSSLVLTGSLGADGKFKTSNLALEKKA